MSGAPSSGDSAPTVQPERSRGPTSDSGASDRPRREALRLAGVARSFGAFALGPLSLSVRAGEYWVILGPSGCGKSMLLQTICGFHCVEAGTMSLEGRDATFEPPEARAIGLVFQHAALFPHYSVRGNIAYGLEARGLKARAPAATGTDASKTARAPAATGTDASHKQPGRAQRVDEIVAALGIGGIVDRPVVALSGGEAQRVAIARAVAPEPTLLLLDEPLSLLDHNTRLELQSQLRRWHQELRLTTLHVTHSRDEARALGTHCAVMLGGTIVQAGPIDEVFGKPRCQFVATFLGLPASAAVDQHDCAATCALRCTDPGEPPLPDSAEPERSLG